MNKYDEDWERITKETTQESSATADTGDNENRNKKGKGLVIVLVIAALALLAVFVTVGVLVFQKTSGVKGTGPAGKEKYYFRAGEKYLEVYDGKEFTPVFLKGVNLGVGKPWYYPGEFAITKEEYSKWFKQIAEMNANCIRVYTVQNPAFYEAFYDYNVNAQKPLYLFHGTWYNEDIFLETANAFDKTLREELYKDEKDIIDIIHGNCTIKERTGHASGTYKWDISPWVMGWILGIESDDEFVSGTNSQNPDKTSYSGKYFTAENVQPFEVFWAETSDEIAAYEMDKYGMQRPLTYTNWPTTDMMRHASETMDKEDSSSLNVENIHPTKEFEAGLFASYHIYPYYPNFMYTDEGYSSNKDAQGNVNTYMAYLKDLISRSHVPVMVGEYGVPVCKGLTHTNPLTGFDQGNHTEKEQGEMLVSMMKDIKEAGYAGGLIFTWQDEWFKRTWNTMDYTDPNRRAFWDDDMTNEQHFGILDFVPGETEPTVILDGKDNDWDSKNVVYSGDGISLSAKYDCGYLYLMVRKSGADWDNEKITIPFDITPLSGTRDYGSVKFDRDADFVMTINGKENSTMKVQDYYDRFLFTYKRFPDIIPEWTQPAKNSDKFTEIIYLVERELKLPDRNKVYPLRVFDGGKMVFGNTDYNADEYNSIADFYYSGDVMEIRIPWLELNFRDPSSKEIEGDFWEIGDFSGKKIDGIFIGITDKESGNVNLQEYTWPDWDRYPYFERLRKSYYILKDALAGL